MNLDRGDFNIDFNKNFEKEKELNKRLIKQKEQNRIKELNKKTQNKPKSIYELSILDILINVKDAWFELIDDLLQGNYKISDITKNNKLFYIGLTIIGIVLLIFFYLLFTTDDVKDINKENAKIIKVYHIHTKNN